MNRWIEMWYNQKWLHSSLGYVPPNEYEKSKKVAEWNVGIMRARSVRFFTQVVIILIVLVPAISFGSWSELMELSQEDVIPHLQDMSSNELNLLVRQVWQVDQKVGTNENLNCRLIIHEQMRRIEAEPGDFLFLLVEDGEKQDPLYREYLFGAFASATEVMTAGSISKFLLITQQVIVDRGENESVRISALKACDEIVFSAKRAGVSLSEIEDFKKLHLDILLDPSETVPIRTGAMKSVYDLQWRSVAPQLLELYISGNASIAPLDRNIISTLGAWQYMEVLPVCISLLKSTSDQKLRDSTAGALGRLGVFEIVRPLVECIGMNKDGNFACRRSLNKNAPLLYSALRSGDDNRVELALRACRHVRGSPEDLIASLIPLLEDDNPQIVLSAARRLAQTRDPDVVSLLLKDLRSTPGSELDELLMGLRATQKGGKKALKNTPTYKR